jgi:hypothetical protein
VNQKAASCARFLRVFSSEVLNKIVDHIGIEKMVAEILFAMTSFGSSLGLILIYVIFILVEQKFFWDKIPDVGQR